MCYLVQVSLRALAGILAVDHNPDILPQYRPAKCLNTHLTFSILLLSYQPQQNVSDQKSLYVVVLCKSLI